MKLALLALACLCLPACTMIGTVGVRGAFENAAEAPKEIRYMMHQGYGLSALDVMFSSHEQQGGEIRSLYPDAAGNFASPPETVFYHAPPTKAPMPAYWLSFSNEKTVLYGMGWVDSRFDYRTIDRDSHANVDRAATCWLIRSGEFVYPPEGEDREVHMKVAIARNPEAKATCQDAPG